VSRTISIAVLLAVIAPSFVIFTGLLQNSESTLPACCRRDGKHHCAMMDTSGMKNAAGETQMTALPPICPFRSQASSIPYVASYLPASSLAHFSGLQSHPAIHAQTFAALRVSETRSHQKRGPPAQFHS
jgi:hypothetical protein